MEDIIANNPALDALPLDMLDLSMGSLIAGLIFGVIGIWLYRHAKKTDNRRVKYSAILLMVYPIFVSGWLWNWVIGLVICGYVFYWWD